MGQLNLYKRIFWGPLKVVVSGPKKSFRANFSQQRINLTNFSTANRNHSKTTSPKKLNFLGLHTPPPPLPSFPTNNPPSPFLTYFLLSMYYDATYMYFNLLSSSGSDMLLWIFCGRIRICSQHAYISKHNKFCCVAQ